MTTLQTKTNNVELAPIAEAIALELQDLRENHEYEKNRCQAAIADALEDFAKACIAKKLK
jgi:predicted component of type VI protein secretion system